MDSLHQEHAQGHTSIPSAAAALNYLPTINQSKSSQYYEPQHPLQNPTFLQSSFQGRHLQVPFTLVPQPQSQLSNFQPIYTRGRLPDHGQAQHPFQQNAVQPYAHLTNLKSYSSHHPRSITPSSSLPPSRPPTRSLSRASHVSQARSSHTASSVLGISRKTPRLHPSLHAQTSFQHMCIRHPLPLPSVLPDSLSNALAQANTTRNLPSVLKPTASNTEISYPAAIAILFSKLSSESSSEIFCERAVDVTFYDPSGSLLIPVKELILTQNITLPVLINSLQLLLNENIAALDRLTTSTNPRARRNTGLLLVCSLQVRIFNISPFESFPWIRGNLIGGDSTHGVTYVEWDWTVSDVEIYWDAFKCMMMLAGDATTSAHNTEGFKIVGKPLFKVRTISRLPGPELELGQNGHIFNNSAPLQQQHSAMPAEDNKMSHVPNAYHLPISNDQSIKGNDEEATKAQQPTNREAEAKVLVARIISIVETAPPHSPIRYEDIKAVVSSTVREHEAAKLLDFKSPEYIAAIKRSPLFKHYTRLAIKYRIDNGLPLLDTGDRERGWGYYQRVNSTQANIDPSVDFSKTTAPFNHEDIPPAGFYDHLYTDADIPSEEDMLPYSAIVRDVPTEEDVLPHGSTDISVQENRPHEAQSQHQDPSRNQAQQDFQRTLRRTREEFELARGFDEEDDAIFFPQGLHSTHSLAPPLTVTKGEQNLNQPRRSSAVYVSMLMNSFNTRRSQTPRPHTPATFHAHPEAANPSGMHRKTDNALNNMDFIFGGNNIGEFGGGSGIYPNMNSNMNINKNPNSNMSTPISNQIIRPSFLPSVQTQDNQMSGYQHAFFPRTATPNTEFHDNSYNSMNGNEPVNNGLLHLFTNGSGMSTPTPLPASMHNNGGNFNQNTQPQQQQQYQLPQQNQHQQFQPPQHPQQHQQVPNLFNNTSSNPVNIQNQNPNFRSLSNYTEMLSANTQGTPFNSLPTSQNHTSIFGPLWQVPNTGGSTTATTTATGMGTGSGTAEAPSNPPSLSAYIASLQIQGARGQNNATNTNAPANANDNINTPGFNNNTGHKHTARRSISKSRLGSSQLRAESPAFAMASTSTSSNTTETPAISRGHPHGQAPGPVLQQPQPQFSISDGSDVPGPSGMDNRNNVQGNASTGMSTGMSTSTSIAANSGTELRTNGS